MRKSEPSRLIKTPLWKWIFSKSIGFQVLLLIAAVLAAAANLLPLEMQKRIVNEAIGNKDLEQLMLYCGIYLAAVVTTTALKYMISVFQTIIGQRVVCEMRNALYRHVLTLPLGFYRRTQPGLVVSALSTELATAGDFIGMAVAVPATNLLMLSAFAGYLFWLNPFLTALSFSIYPVILLVIPLLQKQVNRYNRKRVDATRKMSGKIGEIISGIHEVHASNTYESEGDKFEGQITELYRIRVIWNLFRQGVKRTNSLIVNFSRFLVFAFGGYLVLRGHLELGALVAFISAQDKLYDPWKELINFYQAYQTAKVTYDRTMRYFDVETDTVPGQDTGGGLKLKGDIRISDLEYVTEDGIRLISDINLKLKPGEQMALVGFSGSGKSTLAKCIGQLYPYSQGSIQIGKKEVSTLSKADIARTVGFVSQNPFIFDGTIRENLLYASDQDGHGSTPNLDRQIQAIQQTGLFVDILGFGLNTILDTDTYDDMVEEILTLRQHFHDDYKGQLSDEIEFYDPKAYLYGSSVAENLMFGESLRNELRVETLSGNDEFILFLKKSNLLTPLLHLGAQLAEDTLHFYDSHSGDKEFETENLIFAPEKVKDYKSLLYHYDDKFPEKSDKQVIRTLLETVLKFVPDIHVQTRMPEELAVRIIAERARFKTLMPRSIPCEFQSCDPSSYLYTRTILANIIFGNIRKDDSAVKAKIHEIISRLLVKTAFLETVMKIGLDYQVGGKGSNLSGGQKQKLAIARALIKEPSVLIMDEATSGLDNHSQERIQTLFETQWRGRCTLISVAHRLDTVRNYDRIAVMKNGKIMEMGSYDELTEKQGLFYELQKKRRAE